MKKELIELFQNNEELSYRNIKRLLGVSKRHIDDELKEILRSLELEGILYLDKDGLYKSVPSFFFVKEIYETKKGNRYIVHNDERVPINKHLLNGALTFDKVLVSLEGEAKVVKVIERSFPNIVCEVVMENGIKKLSPINTNNEMELIAGSLSMKKLLVGEVVLVNVKETLFDDKYDAEVIKRIGFNTDPDIDYKTVLYNHGFSIEFPKEAIKEAEELPIEVLETDLEGRLDLRDKNIFTIDGEDCKDMDDAVSIERTSYGYLLGVHIAHVSHYVKPGMTLFDEALNRGTSVYFPDSVNPMLPYILSNGICSLNEGVNRLTRTFLIKFDSDGNIIDYNIYKSVIKSKKKMNYNDVDKVLNGEIVKGYEPFVNDLNIMNELSNKLSDIKNKRGYLGFDSDELSFDIDEHGNTNSIKVKNRCSSEEMIENFMLIPNHLVTHYIGSNPCIYRNHPLPSEEKIQNTLLLLKDLGYRIQGLSNMKKQFLLQRLIDTFKDKEEFMILSNLILRSVKLAYYDTVNEGHFGLALDDGYTHYTSPIRRLPDLLIHTILDMYEEGINEEEFTSLNNFLTDASKRASQKERLAESCEYEVDKLQIINYIKQHIGEEREVFIESITTDGLVVRSKELMDGFIRIDDFNNHAHLYPSGKLKSLDNGKTYKIGHKLAVTIKDASYRDRIIYYSLVDNLTLEEASKLKLKK